MLRQFIMLCIILCKKLSDKPCAWDIWYSQAGELKYLLRNSRIFSLTFLPWFLFSNKIPIIQCISFYQIKTTWNINNNSRYLARKIYYEQECVLAQIGLEDSGKVYCCFIYWVRSSYLCGKYSLKCWQQTLISIANTLQYKLNAIDERRMRRTHYVPLWAAKLYNLYSVEVHFSA